MSEQLDFKRWASKRKATLLKGLMRGQATIAETAKLHYLALSEIEKWVDEAGASMENVLRANPRDVTEQYKKKLEELRSAYGDAILQVKAI